MGLVLENEPSWVIGVSLEEHFEDSDHKSYDSY